MKKINQSFINGSLIINSQLGMETSDFSQGYISQINGVLGNSLANTFFNSTMNLKVKVVASDIKTDILKITSLNNALFPAIRSFDGMTKSVILARGGGLLGQDVIANPNILAPVSMVFTDINGYLCTPLNEVPFFPFTGLPPNVKLNDRIALTEANQVSNQNRIYQLETKKD